MKGLLHDCEIIVKVKFEALIVSLLVIQIETAVSSDAGNYICDFVYFKSLHATGRRSLFVHVPELGKGLTVQQMTEGLRIIVTNVIKQMDSAPF